MNLPASDRRTRLPGHLYLTLAEADPDRAVTTLHIGKTHLAPTGYLHAATAVADAVRALDVSLRPPAEPDLQSVTAMWQLRDALLPAWPDIQAAARERRSRHGRGASAS